MSCILHYLSTHWHRAYYTHHQVCKSISMKYSITEHSVSVKRENHTIFLSLPKDVNFLTEQVKKYFFILHSVTWETIAWPLKCTSFKSLKLSFPSHSLSSRIRTGMTFFTIIHILHHRVTVCRDWKVSGSKWAGERNLHLNLLARCTVSCSG